MFAVVVVLVIVAISVRYTGDENASSSVPYYAPGDTMLLSYSSSFCESLTLTDASAVRATLYVLNKKPPLSGFNSFDVSINQTINRDEYSHWMYYLYPGSNLTLDACVVSQSLTFYVVRGQSNFEDWEDYPRSGYSEESVVISTLCKDGKLNRRFYFNKRADNYYFPFDNFGTVSSTLAGALHFERPEYNITDERTIVKRCEAGGTLSSSCSIDIPLSSSYYVLLVVDPPQDGDWSKNINIDWSCNPRVWLYVVVVLTPLLFSVLCIVVIAIACWCVKTRRWKRYQPLSDPSEAANPQPQYEPAPATAPPGTQGKAYGATEPPPTYASVMK